MLHALTDNQVLQHYIRFWGEPRRVLESTAPPQTPPGPIYVAEFFLGTQQEPYWAYATVGASRSPMCYPETVQGQKSDFRFELLIYSLEQDAELIGTLRALANYPFYYKTYIGIGHRIAGSEGAGVVEGSPLTDILFAPPLNEPREFASLHLDGNLHTDILWVTPIYQSERLYAQEHGWLKLIELFADKEIDSEDFQRAPVV